MSLIGYCTRAGMGHKYHPGSMLCTRCGHARSVEEAREAADARDAHIQILEEQRADFEAHGWHSDSETDAHRGRPE